VGKRTYLIAASLLVVLLLSGIGAGWTLAWLTAETKTVKNRFTVGSVQIQLTETFNTDLDEDQKPDAWTGILVPGTELFKNPQVTVPADCEDSWVFVQLKESDWPAMPETDGNSRKVDYVVEDGWQRIAEVEHVYFREVKRSEQERTFPVLKQDRITVSESLTKTEMKTLDQAKLTVIAYAVQQAGFDSPADAWEEVKSTV